jgi:hypothetical protein
VKPFYWEDPKKIALAPNIMEGESEKNGDNHIDIHLLKIGKKY